MSGATGLHNEASSRPNLSGQPTTSDLVLQIRKHVLETKAADAMLNNLNDEGIKFIKVLELTGRIMFQRRRWSESEIDIVLLDDHVWTRGERGQGVGAISTASDGCCCCDRGGQWPQKH